MLGKLIKYELKHTSKTMLLTYAALAIATVMGAFALDSQYLKSFNNFLDILCAVMLVLYIIAIIGIYCIDFIYLCAHYHKTMYSSQGYLTHTLPVSPAATFGAKILVFFTWMFISSVLCVLSVMILLQVGTGGKLLRELSLVTWGKFSGEVYDLFGISAGVLFLLFLAEAVLGILLHILWVAASMAIGQLFQKNRTAMTIVAGVCFYAVNQIISTIYLAVMGYNTKLFINGDLNTFMNVIIIGSLVMSTVFVIVLYGICVYINKKRLNLE